MYNCNIPAGIATGELTSLYLWGTLFNQASVEAELNANDPPYSSIEPTPAGFLPLNKLQGVPRFQDLPTDANNFGDERIVALTNQAYYWNGTTWKPINTVFLFGIANMPYSLKFDSEDSLYQVALQF